MPRTLIVIEIDVKLQIMLDIISIELLCENTAVLGENNVLETVICVKDMIIGLKRINALIQFQIAECATLVTTIIRRCMTDVAYSKRSML